MYRYFIRPLLFLFPPEQAHRLAMFCFKLSLFIPGMKWGAKRLFHPDDQPVEIQGIHFKNPIGLAAGFDKDGKYIREIEALGFGFMEIGTVTPRPQSGNPPPRLFRLHRDEALINRMGFNNDGVDKMVERLQKITHRNIVIGGNIGKNKDTPNASAHEDYRICFVKLHPYVDFFVVNVSSPNTPNLRALQEADSLNNILNTLRSEAVQRAHPKPIFLKISPDLPLQVLSEITQVCAQNQLAGIIATNTSIARSGLNTPSTELDKIGTGGLSGPPIHQRSVEVIRTLKEHLPANMTLVGVGGIQSPRELDDMRCAGAELFEVFTGFIYQGPALLKSALSGGSTA